MKTKLTETGLAKLTAPEGKRVYAYDATLPGFGVIVTPAGSKTFFVDYRPGHGGRSADKKRYRIGPWGAPWTLTTARAEAKRILGLVADGMDPQQDRVQGRAERAEAETFKAAADRFVKLYCKTHQRRWKESERILDRDVVPVWRHKLIGEVEPKDVTRLLDKYADRPALARQILALVRKLFNWLKERHEVSENPAAGAKAPGKMKSRERALDDDELRLVWIAGQTMGNPFAEMTLLLMLTGARRGEVGGMCWSELDGLDGPTPTWTIPGDRAKNHRAHTLPLVPTAVEIIKAQPKLEGVDMIWTQTLKTPPSGWSKAKARLDQAVVVYRKAEGLDRGEPLTTEYEPLADWTWHDLRRSVATGLVRLGVHPATVERILNHTPTTGGASGLSAVWEVYNRHSYDREMREALISWEAHILDLVEGRKPDGEKVLDFTKAKKAAMSKSHNVK